ncbi:MAG: transcriptional regulator [Clostridia bacterium]|nr:transcriptional regulator [Clostridia bacterium]
MPKLRQNIEGCSPEKFQQRLKELIEESGMSQRRVSIKSDINPYIITKAVRYAVVPSMRTIIKLADTLDVSIAYLIGDSDEKNYVKAKKPSTFHKRIQKLADDKKLKFSEISRDMPFAHNAIYEWMRTETIPSLGYMKTIAAYFNVSLDYITGRTDKKR